MMATPTAQPGGLRERLLYLIELHRRGNAEQAIQGYQEILRVEPAQFDARRLLGAALLHQDLPERALPEIERALQLRSDVAEAWALHGVALGFLGRHGAAVASYERALKLQPANPSFRMNHAMLLLLLGQLESGWDGWEMRLRPMGQSAPRMAAGVPVWDGMQALAGKTLLLVAEQGLGDTIHFCRYVPLLAQRGVRVLLTVPPPLRRLFGSLDGVAHLIDDGETVAGFDSQCLLLSLPHRFRTALSTIPADVPYLAAPPDRVSWWQAHLGPARRPRVGLAYSGNPNHGNDRNRSIPVDRLEPLAGAGVEIHLLQNLVRDEDSAWLQRLGIVDHRAELRDFAETAALAACMDAIVSVDTAAAHLAGALNLPLLLLLPAVPDWRWMLGRDDSPWYPSARLIRQRTAGDWVEPLRHAADALGSSFR